MSTTQFPPPPTYAEVILVDRDNRAPPRFNPIWLKWFLDVAALFTAAGGGGGGGFAHNSLTGLQGGGTGEYYHLTAANYANVVTSYANLGGGAGVLASIIANALNAKSLVAGTGMSLSNTATEITFNATSGLTTISNVGAAAEVLKSLSGGTLTARTIKQGTGVTVTQNADDITIAATGSATTYAATCNGRLTLTSGTPVTTTNVTGATTVYLTPYKGNQIALYNGSTWDLYPFTERTLAVPATTSTMYDVFIYDNTGTLTLEAVAWTNDTTRATALAVQNGVYCKTGALGHRYLGSFRTTGSSGQTEDSLAKRYVWNYYNRVLRPMQVLEATASWTYSSTAWRQANNSTSNQLDFVVGVSEDAVSATSRSSVTNSTSTARSCYGGIGLNSTSSLATGAMFNQVVATSAGQLPSTGTFLRLVPAGRNTLVWLEQGAGADTQTWYGTIGASNGIFGSLFG